MSTEAGFMEFIADQLAEAGVIRYRKMFGEYALYCDEKVVALVCNDQLFIKPTKAGRAFVEKISEAAPYPGAKMYFLIEDQIEDKKWLCDLLRMTAAELPVPKPKKKKIKKKKKS